MSSLCVQLLVILPNFVLPKAREMAPKIIKSGLQVEAEAIRKKAEVLVIPRLFTDISCRNMLAKSDNNKFLVY